MAPLVASSTKLVVTPGELVRGGPRWPLASTPTLAQLKARNVSIAYGPYPAKPNAPTNFIIQDNVGNLIQFFGKSVRCPTPMLECRPSAATAFTASHRRLPCRSG
jgi:hypothetical protein